MAEAMSRRTMLGLGAGAVVMAAGAGAALIETQVLPGRRRLHHLFGLDGPEGSIPAVERGPSRSGSFVGAGRREVAWTLTYPPGHDAPDPLPVVVALHGRTGDETTARELGLDRFLAQAVDDGATPMALASLDGGDVYWHGRASGVDPATDLTNGLLPVLADLGLVVDHIGLLGWSMGGYGALLYGARHPDAVAAVATSSAALFRSFGASAEGAFDDAADFLDNDVFVLRPKLATVPLWMGCGTDDPFIDANRAFVDGLAGTAHTDFGPGAHTYGYWRHLAPAQFRFLSDHLAT